ncbi:DNA topoisomerase I, mitochondrial-like isoform X2 [Planococcus citri]|uniref:DNA topoisomerase I, mitochondrial-like isoform X2 n=1 Tax=Planococcus citri TaxID=170843 RepID=UPI0031F8472D
MESPAVEFNDEAKFAVKDGEVKTDHVMNGLSNGINNKSDSHHKHKHKDKDKDKDKHHDRHKHKDKDKDRDREKHSSSKDKSSKESSERKHKDERRDKDRDREKEKSKEHRDRDHHSSSKHRESGDKVKDKDNAEKNKENRDKEHKDKSKNHSDKHRSHDSSKSKEHRSSTSGSSSSKSHSSSSSSKDKHHSSSSSSKDKHSSDKHKDRHSTSSSDKHSSKHSSDKKSSSDKDRSADKSDKHKDRHESDKKPKENEEKKIKTEPEVEIKKEIQNDSWNEEIFVKQKSMSNNQVKQEVKSEPEEDEEEFEESQGEDTEDQSDRNYESSLKSEADSEDDVPLAQRSSIPSKRKSYVSDDDEDDVPLSARKKVKKEAKPEKPKKRKKDVYSDDESEDDRKKKKSQASKSKVKKEPKSEPKQTTSPTKKKKKDEEEETVWKWWEEEKKEDGVKWRYLEHKGPLFAPAYERLPRKVKFYYDGKAMELSQDAEEIATFYAPLIDHDYSTKEQFNKNFFKDWRKSMTKEEKEIITDLKKCNFREIQEHFKQKSEERKAMSKEEKLKRKEENEAITLEYGFCTIDGHKEKIGNFKIEPPGLFRGRGEHPKMGMLKKRVQPEDVIINCSKDAKVPKPPEGRKWKEVRHDNSVTWLASWIENVQGQVKYVMLNPSSKLKGEKDWQKYETARKLAKCVDKIRQDYREDWKSKEMRIRQRAVAMYFIDKLALRAGNEKDEDQADTVGCCSLRVEHIQLHDELNDKENVVVFDFLGKDSIRYYNEVPVDKRVFKNLKLFCENKKEGDELFDRLNTGILNKHLNELMEGLTAKVFRTYNASITLQNQLRELTDPNASVAEKLLQYNRANRAVAILCNHQRAIPKSHEKSMGNLKQKIETKKEQVAEAQKQYKEAKRDAKDGSAHSKMALEKKKKALERLKEQLMKLEVQETDREENKTIALGTSKLNYLDPRISVAWCKKYDVPIEKVYNKTQRSKFRWAIDMAGPDFVF